MTKYQIEQCQSPEYIHTRSKVGVCRSFHTWGVSLSSVCVPSTILIFSIYWPVLDMAFSLQLFLEVQHPGVTSSLLTLRLLFYLMKLPVEDL